MGVIRILPKNRRWFLLGMVSLKIPKCTVPVLLAVNVPVPVCVDALVMFCTLAPIRLPLTVRYSVEPSPAAVPPRTSKLTS